MRSARAAAAALAVSCALAAAPARAATRPDLDHNTTATGVAVGARVLLSAASVGLRPHEATAGIVPSSPAAADPAGGTATPAPVPAASGPLLGPAPCVRRKFGGTLANVYSFCGDAAPPPRAGRGRAPRVDPETIARVLADRARANAPTPAIRIAPGRIGTTGLASYFWVAPPEPITATARAAGTSITATAEAVQHSWSFGDGAGHVASDPGRPWAPGRPGTIAHVYETPGRFEATVEQIWRARWRVRSGPWRDLGYFSVSGTRTYPVREVVAFLVRS